MARLVGLDYTKSIEKVQFDDTLNEFVAPIARQVERAAIRALSRVRNGEDPYFIDKRLGNGGLHEFPKIRTMRASVPNQPGSGKVNSKMDPRIYSGLARFLRDMGIDELPQLRLIPHILSYVGPRTFYPDDLDHYLELGKKQDSGLARDSEELYLNPDIRHGITGPSQRLWVRSDHRSPELVASCMRADLSYYLERATRLGDMGIIMGTPVNLIGGSMLKLYHRLDSGVSIR